MLNKIKNLKSTTKVDFATYFGVIVAFIVITILMNQGMLKRAHVGMLVPICSYITMAVALNLVVGISGELSLGHAGFMSIGAFTGVIAAMRLTSAIPSEPIRLAVAMVVAAVCSGAAGAVIGIPVLRLRGDYLAIVTLAFGEIIKELMNCLIVGHDSEGLHIIFNYNGSKSVEDLHMLTDGAVIVKGAQGTVNVDTISTFAAGFVLVMVTLVIVLNLVRSRSGRAILACRDNRIAAESVGINVTSYKMMAFVTSAALAGAAGALYGLNFSSMQATKFDFNQSILVLVFVVLGGLGNIWGSIIAATVLYILPEALREVADLRMLVYAIVLIVVMLATNSPAVKNVLSKILPKRRKEMD